MFKIAILLRTNAKPNFFRELVTNSLNANFNKYIVCSAFFQENNFSTSSEIILALNNTKMKKKLDIYGLYRGAWNKQFNICCMNLLSYSQNTNNIKFSFFKFKPNSHAKIFIAKYGRLPQLAIIGSSNLSAGAFADRNQKDKWNQESDVLIWNTSCNLANDLVSNFLEKVPDESKHFIYISTYDDSYAYSPTCIDKLRELEKLMKNNSNIFNP